jgi:uncharacterized membrane protein
MSKQQQQRLGQLDALRGSAMVWMTIYHFCFDLNHFGWIRQDFYNDPLWTWQRTAIVSLFLFCVGWSQAATSFKSASVSGSKTASSERLMFSWRRWFQIAACAGAVSVSSYVMYPKSYIYFGVLHAVCVMLLLLWGVRALGAYAYNYLPTNKAGGRQELWLVGLFIGTGLACLALFMYPPVIFNAPPWNILGLITQKPITEDYVPLLPWFALVCLGFTYGQRRKAQRHSIEKKGLDVSLNITSSPQVLSLLSKLGRYSLPYYMLHQPVLIGVLYLLNLGRLA